MSESKEQIGPLGTIIFVVIFILVLYAIFRPVQLGIVLLIGAVVCFIGIWIKKDWFNSLDLTLKIIIGIIIISLLLIGFKFISSRPVFDIKPSNKYEINSPDNWKNDLLPNEKP